VLVEKPLALSRRSAEKLAVLAAGVGRHLIAAPFVHLAPTFRLLWTLIEDGALGHVHSARGLYGNPGATWAAWYYTTGVGTLAEMGIYNLKSLAALVGAVEEVVAVEATAVPTRTVGRVEIPAQEPDVSHVVLRHRSGAVSSVVSSAAIQRYRRPGLELYGTQGTANLLGDDWDPRGVEVWRNELGRWERHEPVDATWLWTDGLRELVEAVAEGREPLAEIDQDLHLLDVVDAARAAAAGGRPTAVASGFPPLDLRLELPSHVHHVHDRTRPIGEQL